MITIEFIQSTVADYFGFTVEKMQSKSRKHELVLARQIAHYFSKRFTDESLAVIGAIIGKKDHATILHSIKTINNLIDTDKKARLEIESLEKMIKKGSGYRTKDEIIADLQNEIEILKRKKYLVAPKIGRLRKVS